MKDAHNNNNFTNYKHSIYILRRVAFIILPILIIIVLLFVIFYNQSEIDVENMPSDSNFIAIGTAPVTAVPEVTPLNENKVILIYHTHNDEAYYKGSHRYVETSTGRSFDDNYNVIAVGRELKKNLEKLGFTVIHLTFDNVSDGFNDAYDTAYENIKKYIGMADIYIDLHRDAYEGGTNYKKSATGKEYAFIRFVVANGKNYDKNPNFTDNYKLAENIKNNLENNFKGITKDTFIKGVRYNQHISNKCLLAEIGNEKNDIQQVFNSTELLAEAIYKSV